MKKIRNVSLLVCGLVVALCAFFSDGLVYAQDMPEYKLAISPSYEDLGNVNPGDVHKGSFKIFNEGKKDFKYSISFAPYAVINETYEPNFTTENNYTEIKKWIDTDVSEGELRSGDEQVVNYSVEIPSDVHGGAQSAAILVTMVNTADGVGNIEAVRQLAYIIYANVDGEITETGKVLENKVPSFLFNPPIIGTSLVENTGNVYTRASYKLQVFPLFSDEEVYTNEENPENNIIFPETKRYNEIKWEGAPQLGIFKVRQTVKIFDDESVTEKLVFLCPIWFLFIVLLLIFCIIFWIVSRVIKRKKEA